MPEDPSKDYYYIQRLTPNTTALLLEYGYIDNPNDVEKLQSNLLNYVEAVVKAVANYAGVPYTPPTGSGSDGATYTVQRGDSLWSIAQKFNTSVAELRRLNNLTSDVLQIGQVLRIPTTGGNQGGSSTYVVQRGDSLWSIATENGVSVNDLINANNLTSTVLQIGQVLRIPGQGDNDGNTGTDTYTVERNDSLWSIAQKFNTTVAELQRLNNLTTNVLQIGQVLRIPGSTTTPRSYTVQSGDSLWSIANRFDTTVLELMNLNNLGTTVLQIGQVLQIP